jgi:hypothetical protein
VTSLHVDFPENWAVLPVRSGGADVVHELTVGLDELGEPTRRRAGELLSGLLPELSKLGVDGFASLTMSDEGGTLVEAVCAVGVVPCPVSDAGLRSIAEGGLHPGLERDTTIVTLPVGSAVRSTAFRLAAELTDEEGLAPYAAEVRFAVPLGDDRIGVLHFETLSLVYLEELEKLFDAIAGTARLQ